MSPLLTLFIIFLYIGVLYLISFYSTRNLTSDTFYLADRKTPWYLVSYGMIGVAISGITFISVPGEVANSNFTYFQLVVGYAIGLSLVALVLLPLFYKNRVVSIYSYLEQRFGWYTHKTGALFFMVAHLLGAAFRLYLMAYVLQLIIFDSLGVPFVLTVLVTLFFIWLYTFRGGIKTVIFTDVLQTTCLLLAAIAGIWAVASQMNLSFFQLHHDVWASPYAQIFDWSWHSPNNFFKLAITGMLLTFTNNGLDQAIMQKHLTCANVGEAQKNIFVLSAVLLVVNLLFLVLGASLLLFAHSQSLEIPTESDQLYPYLATSQLGSVAGTMFVVGMAAAAYSSADTSLTGLTTAFCVDFLGYQKNTKDNPVIRRQVHLAFTVLLFLFIIAFKALNNQSVISAFIKISGYAYGPLLGLFTFGIVSERKVTDAWVPVICLLSPVIAYVVDRNSAVWFGYPFNYETIVINVIITLGGLFLLSRRK